MGKYPSSWDWTKPGVGWCGISRLESCVVEEEERKTSRGGHETHERACLYKTI